MTFIVCFFLPSNQQSCKVCVTYSRSLCLRVGLCLDSVHPTFGISLGKPSCCTALTTTGHRPDAQQLAALRACDQHAPRDGILCQHRPQDRVSPS
jgi:hypothetical protein